MMKKTLCLLSLILLTACSSKTDTEPTAEELAAQAAKNYYQALYQENYDIFLNSRIHAKEMPDSYRKAMLTNLRQHVSQVETSHRGVKEVVASKAQMDSTLHLMQVFLIISYGDSTREEIVVPMVDDDGEWKMK